MKQNLLLALSGLILPLQSLFGQQTVISDESRVLWNSQPRNKSDYKNVVFLLFDDMRADCLGYAGGGAKTPNIDQLASQSCNFSNAMTTTGLCSPSRAALLTGQLGHRTGLDDNVIIWQSRLKGLSLNKTTILEWSREKGYFVGYFGKWHLGADGPIRRGVHRFTKSGFESSPGFENNGSSEFLSVNLKAADKYYEKGKVFAEKPEYYGTAKGTIKETDTYQIANDGVEFLKEVKTTKRPFFMTLCFHGPHPPYKVPAPYNTMYDYRKIILPTSITDAYTKKPRYQREVLWPWHNVGHMTTEDWQKTTSYFYGFVTMIDDAIGMVLETLKNEGLDDNTLIIFASDQGSMLADHGLYDKGPYSYDDLMRIPLLVKVPKSTTGKITRQVSLIDINQTLVEWMGLEPKDQNLDSRSLFPLIQNGNGAWDCPDESFYRYEWYNGKWYGIRTIRTPELKYCYNSVDIDEMYDLETDPKEMNNVYDNPEYASKQSDLQKRLLEHLKKTEDPLYHQMKTFLENKIIEKK